MIGDISKDWLCAEIDPAGGADDLAESVVVALGSDRRASDDDPLPDEHDRNNLRGVWADTDAKAIWGGWPVGIRFWLLRRAKIVGAKARGGATIARIDEYIAEALNPFIDLGVISAFKANTSRKGLHTIATEITMYRGPRNEVALRFQYLWEGVRA